ncbi:MAG: DEAD/DEAH box helicase family protein [Alphaproteobacteria bacterium]|nr:DEAD/DEAH box helicase family protein [Alphaproteobacteria bacterium]
MRQRLPSGIEPAYFDAFVARRRPEMVAALGRGLVLLAERRQAAPPELWSPRERTEANIAAMALLATKEPGKFNGTELRTLARYSGWGGLSIAKAKQHFPEGVPHPEERGLIHEYYTPTAVARAVADTLKPVLPALAGRGDVLNALEPSAGIGRFIQAFSGAGFPPIRWQAVEWSALSHQILAALRPDVDLSHGPFERWVRLNGAKQTGRVQLVVSNPPYGPRGAAITEDPARGYRERKAYLYFLRRSLDLLAEGGLGVFLVPYGFLTGRSKALVAAREKVLKRHHLAAAYRLPSVSPDGRSALFPGAMLVTDLLFFRARGGALPEVDAEDRFILEGRYFAEFPRHVLGQALGQAGGEDDQSRKPRWGYQVQGAFEGLPELVERPMCHACVVADATPAPRVGRAGVARSLKPTSTGLPRALADALSLGARVDRFLAALAREADETPTLMWGELNEALRAWQTAHQNPHAHEGLRALARRGEAAAQRFLAAWTPGGQLIPALAEKPTWRPRVRLTADDVVGQAQALYRTRRQLTISALMRWHRERFRGSLSQEIAVEKLRQAGWMLDGPDWDQLIPEEDYLTGSLWPRYDRAKARASTGDAQATTQAARLLEAIRPVVFEDIQDSLSPRHGWLPLDLVARWMSAALQSKAYKPVQLSKVDGVVRLRDVDYDDINAQRDRLVSAHVVWCVGWMNHDKTVFRPKVKRKEGENLTIKRFQLATAWERSFMRWCGAEPERRRQVEEAYNRAFRGFVPPRFGTEPLQLTRWSSDIRLHPYQVAAARRLLANRRGLLAFDVGLGKTFTGLAVLAAARQEGWARRPVIVVPKSIVWKWHRDIRRVLPDYRIEVIGSKRHRVQRRPDGVALAGSLKRVLERVPKGASKQQQIVQALAQGPRDPDALHQELGGSTRSILKRLAEEGLLRFVYGPQGEWREASETDTPEERAQKWTRFQTGEVDVVLLTYPALGRTRMNEDHLRAYARSVEAIQREVKLSQRNAGKRRSTTERQDALLKEGVAAWVAQKVEIPAGWQYDPGVAWDDLAIDFLMVDEAQNFKNLYLPESREGGVPRFMGNPGEGSQRAWQLDFRAAAVRRESQGAGVFLLSATPAKNSPLEFYNLLQLVDPALWSASGISNPEAFISRYMQVELRTVLNTSMTAEERGAVVGFKNLHELRELLFRYAEFKVARNPEDADFDPEKHVALRLPEPQVHVVEVDLDDAQTALYEQYTEQIEAALKSTDPSDKQSILGLLARMGLVSLHAHLEGMSWKKAKKSRINPSSPKFDACARRVLANRRCGHIIFVDNTAAHWWMRQVLVRQGVPEARIAVLNAEVARQDIERQRIAEAFNGDPENGVEPIYDVVIANAIAYEGVDLQTRTCAIHHLDLPWEPATLQQRNGRGVRQGNTLATIAIYYYFARRSMDGLRFNLIQGKLGWLIQLIESQDRDTNNPGAQQSMGPEEVLLLISRDPEETRKLLARMRAKAEGRQRVQLSDAAGRVLESVNARFRKAERTRDAAEAARLREEAEARLADLARWDRQAWPWADWMYAVRDREVWVVPSAGEDSRPHANMPLYEGMRLVLPDAINPRTMRYLEVGRLGQGARSRVVWLREGGSASWTERTLQELASFEGLTAERMRVGWPSEVDADLKQKLSHHVARTTRSSLKDPWVALGWGMASDDFLALAWRTVGDEVVARLSVARVSGLVPVVRDGGLVLVRFQAVTVGAVLPPTAEGWARFLALAPASGRTFTELDQCAQRWWSRRLPRALLADARRQETS